MGGGDTSSEEGVGEYIKQASLIRQENGKKQTMQTFKRQGGRLSTFFVMGGCPRYCSTRPLLTKGQQPPPPTPCEKQKSLLGIANCLGGK